MLCCIEHFKKVTAKELFTPPSLSLKAFQVKCKFQPSDSLKLMANKVTEIFKCL